MLMAVCIYMDMLCPTTRKFNTRAIRRYHMWRRRSDWPKRINFSRFAHCCAGYLDIFEDKHVCRTINDTTTIGDLIENVSLPTCDCLDIKLAMSWKCEFQLVFEASRLAVENFRGKLWSNFQFCLGRVNCG